MNTNAQLIYPYYKILLDKINQKDFLLDKSGTKTVEVISPRIVLDPKELYIDFETRKSPRKYIKKELEWYHSHSLNIEKVSDVEIWKKVSDKNSEINSNYGNLVYSRNNFSQFNNVLDILKNHKDSRQGIIIYTRPSIHYEWNSQGASDFICTNYQHFLIRDNKLNCITSMRSNDCWYGTFSDIPWFHSVIQEMFEELKLIYQDLSIGDHIFMPNSFHCYERNFKDLTELVEAERS
jgi:thymidylate synthase